VRGRENSESRIRGGENMGMSNSGAGIAVPAGVDKQRPYDEREMANAFD
jgi:hypothetical protein